MGKKRKRAPKRFSTLWDSSRKKKIIGNTKRRSLWDLHKHGVSYSMISRFLECRERFRLDVVEGWQETKINVPLEFGSIFHEAMEAQCSGHSWKRAINQYYLRAAKRLGPAEKEEMSLVVGVVHETYPRYVKHWDSDKDKQYIYREKEFAFTRILPSQRTIKIVGKMDAAYMLKQTQLWLQENKTKGIIDEHLIQSTLPQDLQTMIYSWALGKMTKRPVTGILYNVIRRAGLRRKVNETLVDFLARIGEDIDERPEHYFLRWEHILSTEEVDLFLTRMLDPILEQIYDWWESIKTHPFEPWVDRGGNMNPLHYQRPFGVYDPMGVKGYGNYFQLLTKGSYFGLHQREDVFPELETANK